MSDTPRTDAQVELVTFRPGPIQAMADFARTLERELAALRADKERLDWLEKQSLGYYYWEYRCDHRGFLWLTNSTSDGNLTARAAIDAARNGDGK